MDKDARLMANEIDRLDMLKHIKAVDIARDKYRQARLKLRAADGALDRAMTAWHICYLNRRDPDA